MKFDTRSKSCKRLSLTHECYLSENKAIPASAMLLDGEDGESPQSPDKALGRRVAYEPYLFHTPVVESTRIRARLSGGGGSGSRVSKKYMQKLNEEVESAGRGRGGGGGGGDDRAADDLAASLRALVLSDSGRDRGAPPCKAEPREDGPAPDAVSSSSTDSSDRESEGDEGAAEGSGGGSARRAAKAAPALGRVRVKVVDKATRKETYVSRSVRFLDAEEAEI
jgi:hypothetical protein